MKSASGNPVTPPLIVKAPPERELVRVTQSFKATVPPNPNWWLPRIHCRSSEYANVRGR